MNEHAWKVPDGRMAPRLTPLDRRKLFILAEWREMLAMSIGKFLSAEVLADGITCELDTVAAEAFSSP